MSARTENAASPAMRWVVIAAIAGVAFFASYRYAVAAGSSSTTSSIIASGSAGGGSSVVANGSGGCCGGGSAAGAAGATSGTGSAAGSTTGGGGCCGGTAAPASAQAPKSATVTNGVQKITVDTSKGYYNPTTIQLKAGVPAEITFTQSAGCLGQVVSEDLGFSEDLTSGAKVIKLGALKPGTYVFHCGMNMQSGSIVVK